MKKINFSRKFEKFSELNFSPFLSKQYKKLFLLRDFFICSDSKSFCCSVLLDSVLQKIFLSSSFRGLFILFTKSSSEKSALLFFCELTYRRFNFIS